MNNPKGSNCLRCISPFLGALGQLLHIASETAQTTSGIPRPPTKKTQAFTPPTPTPPHPHPTPFSTSPFFLHRPLFCALLTALFSGPGHRDLLRCQRVGPCSFTRWSDEGRWERLGSWAQGVDGLDAKKQRSRYLQKGWKSVPYTYYMVLVSFLLVEQVWWVHPERWIIE